MGYDNSRFSAGAPCARVLRSAPWLAASAAAVDSVVNGLPATDPGAEWTNTPTTCLEKRTVGGVDFLAGRTPSDCETAQVVALPDPGAAPALNCTLSVELGGLTTNGDSSRLRIAYRRTTAYDSGAPSFNVGPPSLASATHGAATVRVVFSRQLLLPAAYRYARVILYFSRLGSGPTHTATVRDVRLECEPVPPTVTRTATPTSPTVSPTLSPQPTKTTATHIPTATMSRARSPSGTATPTIIVPPTSTATGTLTLSLAPTRTATSATPSLMPTPTPTMSNRPVAFFNNFHLHPGVHPAGSPGGVPAQFSEEKWAVSINETAPEANTTVLTLKVYGAGDFFAPPEYARSVWRHLEFWHADTGRSNSLATYLCPRYTWPCTMRRDTALLPHTRGLHKVRVEEQRLPPPFPAIKWTQNLVLSKNTETVGVPAHLRMSSTQKRGVVVGPVAVVTFRFYLYDYRWERLAGVKVTVKVTVGHDAAWTTNVTFVGSSADITIRVPSPTTGSVKLLAQCLSCTSTAVTHQTTSTPSCPSPHEPLVALPNTSTAILLPSLPWPLLPQVTDATTLRVGFSADPGATAIPPAAWHTCVHTTCGVSCPVGIDSANGTVHAFAEDRSNATVLRYISAVRPVPVPVALVADRRRQTVSPMRTAGPIAQSVRGVRLAFLDAVHQAVPPAWLFADPSLLAVWTVGGLVVPLASTPPVNVSFINVTEPVSLTAAGTADLRVVGGTRLPWAVGPELGTTATVAPSPIACPALDPAPTVPPDSRLTALPLVASVSGCVDAFPSTGDCGSGVALTLVGERFGAHLTATSTAASNLTVLWVAPHNHSIVHAVCGNTTLNSTTSAVQELVCRDLQGVVPLPHAVPAWHTSGGDIAVLELELWNHTAGAFEAQPAAPAVLGPTRESTGCPLTGYTAGAGAQQCSGHGSCLAVRCQCDASAGRGFWAHGATVMACDRCAAMYNGSEAAGCTARCPGATEPCSGHGVCGNGVCLSCAEGWGRPDCSAQCPRASDGTLCGRGDCLLGNATCACRGNSTGPACDACVAGICGAACDTPCTGSSASSSSAGAVDACASVTCSATARCEPATGSCVCRPFSFNPPLCGTSCPGLNASGDDRPCGGHGTCDGATPVCACSDGWRGDACQLPCPVTGFGTCGAQGQCSANPAQTAALCTCNATWAGAACEGCVPGYYGPLCATLCPGTNASSSAVVCSGHGACLGGPAGSGLCTCIDDSRGHWAGAGCSGCRRGWFGSECDQPCPGVGCGLCGGHGVCSDGTGGTGLCACAASPQTGYWTGEECGLCADGWSGPQCNSSCPKDTTGVKCSGHGVCQESHDGARCGCDFGFTGALCDACLPLHYGPACSQCIIFCSGHGRCNDTKAGTGTCTCDAGHVGPHCAAACPSCSGHGSCEARGSTAVCRCDHPWAGPNCAACAAGSFGPVCAGVCPDCGVGSCGEGLNGTGQCTCPVGLGGHRCTVPCPVGAAGAVCSGHGDCLSATAQCRCHADVTHGFWDGPACDRCAPTHAASPQCATACPVNATGAVCSGRGVCTEGRCTCSTATVCGLACEMSGGDCDGTAPNPCPGQCSGHGFCITATSPPTCSCHVGWGSDSCGVGCPGLCSGHGDCVVNSTQPAGACRCTEGLWGVACNELCPGSVPGTACSGHGECTSRGQCLCGVGFGGSDCNDPCPVGPPAAGAPHAVCSAHGTCTAAATCTCVSGFDGLACETCTVGLSGDECTTPCGGSTVGRQCVCPPGKVGPRCDKVCPIDEDGAVCGGHGACDDANGTCACEHGHYGRACTVRCSLDHCRATFTGTGQWRCSDEGQCLCAGSPSTGYWDGPLCDRCAPGYWGSLCLLTCPCVHATCDRTTGACRCFSDGSRGFWAGDRCDRCTARYVGARCDAVNLPPHAAVVAGGASTGIATEAGRARHLTLQSLRSGDASAVAATGEAPGGPWALLARGSSVLVGTVATARRPATACATVDVGQTAVAAAPAPGGVLLLLRNASGALATVVLDPAALCNLITPSSRTLRAMALSSPTTTPFPAPGPSMGVLQATLLSPASVVHVGLSGTTVIVTAVSYPSSPGSTTSQTTFPGFFNVRWAGVAHGVVVVTGTATTGGWLAAVIGAPSPVVATPAGGLVCRSAHRCLPLQAAPTAGDWVCLLDCSDPAVGSAALLVAATSTAAQQLPLMPDAIASIEVSAATTHDGRLSAAVSATVAGASAPRRFVVTVDAATARVAGVWEVPRVGTSVPVVTALHRATNGSTLVAAVAAEKAVYAVPLTVFAVTAVWPPVLDGTLLRANASDARVNVRVSGAAALNEARLACWFDLSGHPSAEAPAVRKGDGVECPVPVTLPVAGSCAFITVRVGDDAVTATAAPPLLLAVAPSAVLATATNLNVAGLGAAAPAYTPTTVVVEGRGFVTTANGSAACRVTPGPSSPALVFPAAVVSTTRVHCVVPPAAATPLPATLTFAHDGRNFASSALPFAIVGTAAGVVLTADATLLAASSTPVAVAVAVMDAQRNHLRVLTPAVLEGRVARCTANDAAGVASTAAGTGLLAAGVAAVTGLSLPRPALGRATVMCTLAHFTGATQVDILPGRPTALALFPRAPSPLWAATAPHEAATALQPPPTVVFVDGAGHTTAAPLGGSLRATWSEHIPDAGGFRLVERGAEVVPRPGETAFPFQTVAVRGLHATRYTITFTATAAEGIAAASFSVTLRSCAAGEYAAPGTAQCQPCPARAICDGTTNIRSEAPHWRAPSSVEVYECPSPTACLGETACAVGYEGPLCGRCSEGYGRAGSHGCTQCPAAWVSYAVIALILVAVSAATYVLAWRSVAEGADTAARRNPLTLALKLLIGHLQLAAVVGRIPEEIPRTLTSFFGAQERAGSPVSFDLAIVTCVVGGTYQTRLYMTAGAVVCVAVGAILARVVLAAALALGQRLGGGSADLSAEGRARDELLTDASNANQAELLQLQVSSSDLRRSRTSRTSRTRTLGTSVFSMSRASAVSLGRRRSTVLSQGSVAAPVRRRRTASFRSAVGDVSAASLVEFGCVCFVVALFLGYTSLVQAAAGGLRCRTVDRGPALPPSSLLVADTSVDCNAPGASSDRAIAGLLLAALGVAAPLSSVAMLYAVARLFRQGDVAAARRVFYYVTGGYEPARWWWESVLMFRKAIVVAFATVITPEDMAFYTLQWALLLSLCLSFYMKPFTVGLLSDLEAASLAALLLTAYLNSVLRYCTAPTWRLWVWGAAQLVVNAAVIVAFLAVVVRLLWLMLPPGLRRSMDLGFSRISHYFSERRVEAAVQALVGSEREEVQRHLPCAARMVALHATIATDGSRESELLQAAVRHAEEPLLFAAFLDREHRRTEGRPSLAPAAGQDTSSSAGEGTVDVDEGTAMDLLELYDTAVVVLEAALREAQQQLLRQTAVLSPTQHSEIHGRLGSTAASSVFNPTSGAGSSPLSPTRSFASPMEPLPAPRALPPIASLILNRSSFATPAASPGPSGGLSPVRSAVLLRRKAGSDFGSRRSGAPSLAATPSPRLVIDLPDTAVDVFTVSSHGTDDDDDPALMTPASPPRLRVVTIADEEEVGAGPHVPPLFSARERPLSSAPNCVVTHSSMDLELSPLHPTSE